MNTKSTTFGKIKRSWNLIDAKDQILGRMSTQVALMLMGKNKPYFVRNLDCGNYVVVVNAKNVKVSGQKEEKKIYNTHSGYPGGFKTKNLLRLRREKPEDIIRHAVMGMLPNNKLRDKLITRLYIFEDDKHTYTDKKFENIPA